MSYRYILQPERASGQVLESLARRVEQLERRTKWAGATQFAELGSAVNLVDNSWTNVLPVTLIGGRWMLYASATVTSPSIHQLLQARFPVESDSVPAASSTYLSGYGDGTLNLSVVGSINLTGETDVYLQGWSTATSNGAYVTEAFVIAVPT